MSMVECHSKKLSDNWARADFLAFAVFCVCESCISGEQCKQSVQLLLLSRVLPAIGAQFEVSLFLTCKEVYFF